MKPAEGARAEVNTTARGRRPTNLLINNAKLRGLNKTDDVMR